MRWVGSIAGLVITGAIVSLSCAGWGQNSSSNIGSVVQIPSGTRLGGFGESLEPEPGFAERRLRALNEDRHKAMVSDADKLVKLARQLDEEIASNPTNELTQDETRKIAEIEKLARNVKARMIQSFGGVPVYRPLTVPMAGPGVR
jgi:hypothetical protein